jgi:uncharacterized protein GlcG (DUF336 family)
MFKLKRQRPGFGMGFAGRVLCGLELCFPISPAEYAGPMKHVFHLVVVTAFAGLSVLAQSTPPARPADAKNQPNKLFDELADTALQAMTRRAEELQIKGAAVVAYIEGDTVKSWSSKMVVVGTMKNAPSEKNRGANLLAIAYSKAAEMAETLKDSGTAGRAPMTGETGWQGGLIRKGRTGYLIAAFSGGPSEADVKVSQAGLDALAGKL